ncbi:hypothetical protein [Bacteroides fragilis]|uniref:hypothetical protein n=1 Tax=Bacteroides fragilis TaxID=817 RepID=UPI0011C1CFF1|nr:hypothetical protein [Bacteroides fragilis]
MPVLRIPGRGCFAYSDEGTSYTRTRVLRILGRGCFVYSDEGASYKKTGTPRHPPTGGKTKIPF